MGFAASDAVRERIKQAGAEFRANQNPEFHSTVKTGS